jgi:hypothetical protein
MHRRPTLALLVLALALTGGLAAVAPAGAEAATSTTTSSNWAGYAVTRSGSRFHKVTGNWIVPTVTCTSGQPTYSASWIGLGGYATNSQALEQTGTESDCDASGTAHYSAWYELVPDTSHSVQLGVRAGDAMTATVTVTGTTVRLRLIDRTRGTSVTKVLKAQVVDTSSAEWIVESPALCASATVSDMGCSSTALANFGTTGFTTARATTTGGHTGTISDPNYKATAITLTPAGRRRFAGTQAPTDTTAGAATPGALSATGGGFQIAYAQPTATTDPSGGTTPVTPPATAPAAVPRLRPLQRLLSPRAPGAAAR